MLALFLQTLNVTAPVFAMLFLGYGLKRIDWINDNFIKTASALVFNVCMPSLLFLGIYHADLHAALKPGLLVYFVVATVHIVYGKKPSDRVAEIDALSSYWTWLKEVYPGNNHILLMGDFNMPPTSPAWKSLNAAARPLVVAGASTLSTTDGKFANLYDNIFVSHSSPLKVNSVGVYDYPKHLGMTHQQGRANISDHAPIFLRAELGQGKGTATTAASPARPAAPAKTKAATVADATGQVRGNRAKKRYHRPDCPSYNSIAEKNRVEFSSESAAQAEGYSIAGNCQKAS